MTTSDLPHSALLTEHRPTSPQEALNRFVGRQSEFSRLVLALEDVFAGRGRLLAIVGEPGIGKTRIAEELAASAGARGAEVLSAHCHDGGGAPPFWPWRQIVRAHLRHIDDATLAAELGSGAADMARIVEDIGQRLPGLGTLPESLEPDEARFRLFDAFAQFLRAAARRRPLVLCLDDLHWADPPSLRLLQFLGREVADAALMIVMTYREVDVRHDEARAEALGALSRERLYERIPLRGLSQDESIALLTSDLGAAPSALLARTLFERTEGNPFFLKELARDLVEQGRDATDAAAFAPESSPVPQSIRAVISQRLRRLSDETRQLLILAAVVGREFDLAVLGLLGDGNSEALLARLDEAAAAGLLTPVAPGATRGRFTHALVGDVLYDSLPAHERAKAHRRVGDALERRWQHEIDEHAAELAHHFWIGASSGDTLPAVEYARLAAERAATLFAYEDATRFYQQALDALTLDQKDNREPQCRLLLGLGSAQAAVSDINHLRETFRRAADLARGLDDPELLARAAIGFARVPLLGGTVDHAAVALLEEAHSRLPTADGSLRAGLLSILSYALHHSPGMHDRRVALCHEATAMARRIGDARTLARTLYDQHSALFAPENLADRFAAANELLRLAEQTNDRPMLLRARYCRVIDLFELGDVHAAVTEIDALERLADELREPWHHWYAAWFRTAHALMVGRFAAGEELAQQAFQHGERVTRDNALQVFGVQITMLRAMQGRCAEMVPAIRDMVSQFPAMAAWRCALAYHCAQLDEAEEARRHFEVLASDDFAAIPRDGSWMVSISQLADVCSYLNDVPRAAVLYDLLLPYADRLMVVDSALACSGLGARYLGILATTLGQWQAAESHLRHALDMHRRAGMQPWVAQTQFDMACLLVWRDSPAIPPEAEAALSEAAELAGELGMAGLLAKTVALRQRLGSAPLAAAVESTNATLHRPTEASPAPDSYAFLKEGDFWTLSFGGVTCRQKDALGLHYLVQLLRHPGRQFHVLELQALVAGILPESAPRDDPSLSLSTDRLPALDQRAQRAYRQRLAELQQELAEAESFHDPGAVERAQREIELLSREIFGAVRPSSAGERARVSISKRLKAALAKIRLAHPELAEHLGATVKSGYFCSYNPDLRYPIDWQT